LEECSYTENCITIYPEEKLSVLYIIVDDHSMPIKEVANLQIGSDSAGWENYEVLTNQSLEADEQWEWKLVSSFTWDGSLMRNESFWATTDVGIFQVSWDSETSLVKTFQKIVDSVVLPE
jgi:hypothetical protein